MAAEQTEKKIMPTWPVPSGSFFSTGLQTLRKIGRAGYQPILPIFGRFSADFRPIFGRFSEDVLSPTFRRRRLIIRASRLKAGLKTADSERSQRIF
jgi:hypothetical protein